ncbi:DUF2179 domain-containing protein [Mycoplasma enhydrae]|uniref:DUF2179 domain-containing protein n=1 Tax=Mycoplasma enhydrae TaxID=2499220 RepID=UPI00197BC522|nr:DUF2179 domain-containing protein [Mycoplasma enhydrae]MBN4089346.1 YitT family protein [Mycoplasma enhydrae]
MSDKKDDKELKTEVPVNIGTDTQNQIKTEEYRALVKQRKIRKASGKKATPITELNRYGVNFFNVWKKFPKKMLMVFISAILYNVAIATFLAKAATVATGVSAIVQSLTFTVSATAPYFAYIYFAINLPLIIFFWKKNSRLFMILTTYWLLWQVLFQSILLIGPAGFFFQKISIYYVNWYSPVKDGANSFKVLVPWDVYGSYSTTYKELFKWIETNPSNPSGIYILSANVSHELGMIKVINQIQLDQLKKFYTAVQSGFPNPTWPIIVYTIIGASMAGIAGGIAWKNSASTAGGDFIVYYISRVKQKSVGSISTIVALCFGAFSILVITAVEIAGIKADRPLNVASLLLRILCSVAYVFMYTSFIELIFPKYRKIKISIYTKNPDKIIQHFKNIQYWHGYNIAKITGGYTNTDTYKIETFALYLEQNMIKNEILLADLEAWITVTRVHNIIGKFNTSKVES